MQIAGIILTVFGLGSAGLIVSAVGNAHWRLRVWFTCAGVIVGAIGVACLVDDVLAKREGVAAPPPMSPETKAVAAQPPPTEPSAEVKKTQRAYLDASNFTCETVNQNGSTVWITKATVKNVGATPASSLYFTGWADFMTEKQANEKYASLRSAASNANPSEPNFIAAGESATIQGEGSGPGTNDVDGESVTRHIYRDEPLWLFGAITYKDVFDDKWCIKFLYKVGIEKGKAIGYETKSIEKVSLEQVASDASQDTKQAQRARLLIADANFQRMSVNTVEGEVHVSNVGLTAASNIRMTFQYAFCNGNEATVIFKNLKATEIPKPDFLAAGATAVLHWHSGYSNDTFSAESLLRHRHREEPLRVAGEITYDDVFGKKWSTKVMYYISIDEGTTFEIGKPMTMERTDYDTK
jgi:hypothetical protein